jgi:single-stranded-DNA-specific exonuclease
MPSASIASIDHPPVILESEINEGLDGYPQLLQKLLKSRRILNRVSAEKFLRPDFVRDTHDPFLFFGMERSVERILLAIKNDEKIVIFSDYDTDGIPGAVILHDFFVKVGHINFENYIPHRNLEGFGMNVPAIDEFKREGVTLIITVDCGITDIEPIACANDNDIDVIITDHHSANGVMPEAYSIVNPKQEGCTYPDKDLCGAAVAFKLVQALILRGDFDINEGWEKWLLDMAGLATLSDMVPLVGENRALAYYGLLVMRKSRRVGFQKLLSQIRANQKYLTEDDVGFMISPRINAASRMGVPQEAFRLLATADEEEAGILAEKLEKLNNARKGHVAAMVKEVRNRLSKLGDIKEVIVLGNTNWKPSLLGLVANTLAEEYERPVFLWGREDAEHIKGSCRAYGSISVMSMLEQTRDIFLDAGGHEFTGGFSMLSERVHELEPSLIRAIENMGKKRIHNQRKVEPDAELDIDDINWKTFDVVKQLAPFGVGNPKPIFLVKNAEVLAVRKFGKNSEHVAVDLKKFNGEKVSAIKFFTTPERLGHMPETGGFITLLGTLEKSAFMRRPELRLRIVDIVQI